MNMAWIGLPRCVLPEYTWPRPFRDNIAETTPPTPYIPGKTLRRAFGYLHNLLYYVSEWYSQWFGLLSDGNILQLPFGLLIKWNDRITLEEVAAMKMAREAGMPVPKVLTVGEHSGDFRRISVLMTRLPGISLANDDWPLNEAVEQPWLSQLQKCLDAMRKWESPYGRKICSALGTEIYSQRVPRHVMGPFRDDGEMHDFLLGPATGHGFTDPDKFAEKLKKANDVRAKMHNVTFTNGDFKAHNILVGDNNELTGFLDWESGGWYPEYWEFTTAMRFGRDTFWYQVASFLGGHRYMEELDCDRALNNLTVDSYIFF